MLPDVTEPEKKGGEKFGRLRKEEKALFDNPHVGRKEVKGEKTNRTNKRGMSVPGGIRAE